jgi:UDP-GlcNAc:undecaprenyl-phosphate GlcNAc-1-phosphate transferase
MYSLALVAALSFVFSLVLTRVFRDLFERWGIVDRPDGRRKLHKRPVPRIGGVAIALSYVLAFAVLIHSPLSGGSIVQSQMVMIWKLLPAVAVIFFTGLVDDLLHTSPWVKLTGEAAAAMLAYWGGVRIVAIAGYAHFGWLAAPLTIVWLVMCANALNLIDGVDGLAGGVAVLAGVTTFLAAALQGNMALALATLPLIGAVLGFLRYNFSPASVFLGDSGSLLLGFLLGSYGVIWSQKSATMLGMAAPVMALALPLLDVGLSVARRFLNNEPIFRADHGHIHHRLLERGLTPRKAVLLLYGVCGVAAALSLLQSVMHNSLSGLAILLFGGATWLGVQSLGYVEFVATRRFLWCGFRPMLSAHVKLESLERSLLTATSVEQCWELLQSAARAFGYSQLDARLAGATFSSSPLRERNSTFWQLRLNLADGDFVNVTQRVESGEQRVLVVPFIEVVSRILPRKIGDLSYAATVTEATRSLAGLAAAVARSSASYPPLPRNSRTTTVMSSDCAVPSVKAATAS